MTTRVGLWLAGLVLALGVTGTALPAAAAPAASGPNGQTVTASRTSGLDPAGTKVTVKGSGFDPNKGIYVAFCVNKGPGQLPSPCLGGVDMKGESGSSVWISSNPPSYGEGLARPFTQSGGKGSFEVQLTVKAKDQFTNCLDKKTAPLGCVIGTRADHTRTADRSADVLIPVTFTGSGSGGNPTTTPTKNPTNQPTTAPTTGSGGNDTSKPKGSLANTGGLALGFGAAALALLGGGAALVLLSRRKTKEPQA
ncbi:hypothetical protein HPO96_31850 [Kribbella sandramycini]|uniref:LPXTG-motif cell wall-anchored protein n=1 Tax=Kribbella sandramycini TaxID=60450 RepID=A0A7Y4P481_9ACTN|nr:hypothetical protein [Kribbella sandramycini]MBB6567138.1 hypothetical protein [Kribbella sandramycini]NOL44855.1 hypothetical protein [Kribbella sandramycini]